LSINVLIFNKTNGAEATQPPFSPIPQARESPHGLTILVASSSLPPSKKPRDHDTQSLQNVQE
jgi:hypothetical protein